jgi:hypothetical protein
MYFYLFMFKLNLVKLLLGWPELFRQYSDSLKAGPFGVSSPCGREFFRARTNKLRGPPSLLQNGYWGLLPEVKGPDRGVGYTLPSSPEVKGRMTGRLVLPLYAMTS